ncbi:MAG: sulfatase-like hydrolase/transferase, partial [Hyphomicrobiales bacterium]|nr:sulfatase-like hydrolase/transferase [Hyphomicrobiales bacterium]
MRNLFATRALVFVALSAFATGTALAEDNIRGSTTGPTSAPGYSHPDQYAHITTEKPADNMYPVVPHPEQDKAAASKLEALAKKSGKKPNFLIFLLDDVGWMDPGFNGGGIAVGQPTPTLDKLAAEGLILTSAYSTPSCTPSRATIHTGQTPLHHGLLRPPMYNEPGGLAGAVTMPAVLKKLGYVTQGVGKWHMGENKGSLPQNLGYDDYRGFLGVSDMYTEWRDVYFNPEIALSPGRFAMLQKEAFNHHDVHCTPANTEQCEDLKLIDLDYIKDLDEAWTQVSLDFLDKMKGSDTPWYLYHATRGCHFDNYPNDKWAGASRARTVYADCMVQMDDIFKRLVAKLEETGELDNTMIVFTSDNGPECEIPPNGHTPFRGCKGSSWEGGVRVPTFVYWKDMIKPRKSEGLFDQADLFNTLISLAGAPREELADHVPKNRYVDGVDQSSFLIADDGQSARRARIYTMNQYLTAARVDEFKYIITAQVEGGLFDRGYTGGFSGSI